MDFATKSPSIPPQTSTYSSEIQPVKEGGSIDLWLDRGAQVAQILGALSLALVAYQIIQARKAIEQTNEQIAQTNTQIEQTNVQMKQTSAWNRVNTTMQTFNDEYFRTIHAEMSKELAALGIYFDNMGVEALDKKLVPTICVAPKALAACKSYLNYVEMFACAVNRDVLDNELAFNLKVLLVVKSGTVLSPLIEELRQQRGDPLILNELTKLRDEWKPRYEKAIEDFGTDHKAVRKSHGVQGTPGVL